MSRKGEKKKGQWIDFGKMHKILKDYGGFQFEFASISRVMNHKTCYNFECSHWWKIYLKDPLQDLLSSLNAVISTNESTRIITGHVIYNPAYTYKFQLKTTMCNVGMCT